MDLNFQVKSFSIDLFTNDSQFFILLYNLDLTKCQVTWEVSSLYQRSFPYISKGQAGEHRSLYQGLC